VLNLYLSSQEGDVYLDAITSSLAELQVAYLAEY